MLDRNAQSFFDTHQPCWVSQKKCMLVNDILWITLITSTWLGNEVIHGTEMKNGFKLNDDAQDDVKKKTPMDVNFRLAKNARSEAVSEQKHIHAIQSTSKAWT